MEGREARAERTRMGREVPTVRVAWNSPTATNGAERPEGEWSEESGRYA